MTYRSGCRSAPRRHGQYLAPAPPSGDLVPVIWRPRRNVAVTADMRRGRFPMNSADISLSVAPLTSSNSVVFHLLSWSSLVVGARRQQTNYHRLHDPVGMPEQVKQGQIGGRQWSDRRGNVGWIYGKRPLRRSGSNGHIRGRQMTGTRSLREELGPGIGHDRRGALASGSMSYQRPPLGARRPRPAISR